MRKIITLLLCILFCFGCVSCSDDNESMPSKGSSDAEQPKETVAQPTETPTPEPEQEAYEVTYENVKTYVNSIGTVWAQAIAEVTNTGDVPLFLNAGNLDIEDSSGTLVTSRSYVSAYPSIIQPGEKGYYYEEFTLDGYTEAVELSMITRPSITKATVEDIRYTVTEEALSNNDYGGLKFLGRVENTTDTAGTMVYISTVLYDAGGVPIGLMFTILTEDLEAGSKVGFEMSSFALPGDITAESVASFVTTAYPLQFQF